MNALGGSTARAVAAAVVSLSLGVALAPVSATAHASEGAAPAPPVRTIDPAKLRRGPDATIPFLQDGRIHAGGKTVRVRVPFTKGRQALLGRSGNAWLVASYRKGYLRVHRVRANRAPQLLPGSRTRQFGGEFYGIRVSRDGTRLLRTRYDRGGATVVVTRTVDGAPVDDYYTTYYSQPYDADAGRVLLHKEDETTYEVFAADWRPGSDDDRVLGSLMNAGFYRRDLAFVQDGVDTYRFGPTAISAPGAPAWSARFAALDVSPDGSLVLGVGPRLVRKRAVLQVRRMSDGKVLQQFSYGKVVDPGDWSISDTNEQTARFESDTRFVFQFSKAGRSRLVRCTTSGRCAKASDAGSNVSITFERFMW
ncbi:hypothetical protein [Nocardioides daphniae]|nr:hypothetical protein [Nocardioides daphniae]QCC77637.1 hypothetical protein E2C04_11490 [Nocardioides daphniae]